MTTEVITARPSELQHREDIELPFSEIESPLNSWIQATEQVSQIKERYFGPNGTTENLAKRVVDSLVSYLKNKRGYFSSKELAKLSRLAKGTIDQDFQSQNSDSYSIPFFDLNYLAKGTNNPKLMAVVKEIESEGDSLIKQYRQEIEEPNNSKRLSENLLKEKLTRWLSLDFDHLLKLADSLETPETPPPQIINLIRFLDQTDLDVIRKTSQTIRQLELENPSPARLIRFLDQIAWEYHQNGRYDHLWPSIEFFLPILPSEIKTLYVPNVDVSERQHILFGPIVLQMQRFQKSLPQALRELYATHLSYLQEEAIRTIKTASNKFKVKQQETVLPAQSFKDIVEVKKKKPTVTPQVSQPMVGPEPEREQKLLRVLIAGQICTDEQSIRSQLEVLFIRNIKNPRKADIDSYASILAKLAGIRLNSPKYDRKKITDFPRITLSDGSSEQVLRLRLSAKTPPRLLLTLHKDLIIVINVTIRDDNTYRQLMKKGGFSQISLPS